MKEQEPYVALARAALETYLANGSHLPIPNSLPIEMTNRSAGVFVSIKKNGALRGCIGTIQATTPCIAEEIIQNAISAGTQDPRFPPISTDELSSLCISVDVLGEAEHIESIDQLNVKEYGVIVSSGWKRGLLLPNLEGVDSPEEQVQISLQKAGISPDEPYTMERFRVVRHK